jgi:hypothetical protein
MQDAPRSMLARPREWYAIDSVEQRILGPFPSQQKCADAVAGELQRWDFVPLVEHRSARHH